MQISLQTTHLLAEKKKIRNWIIPSIIVIVFLFFPTGIPALIFAIVSRIKLKGNDIAAARKNANIARTLTLIGVVMGIILFIIEKVYKYNTGKTIEYLWFM